MLNVKSDFPILNQHIHGKPLVYLDSSGSSQKPQCVIDAISHYYQNDHANIHRGIYELSERATAAYEKTRHIIQEFIHAQHSHEIIFTRGTTDSINLIATSFAETFLQPQDEIILSEMEHHSNIVPWQQLISRYGIQLKIIPITETGELDLAFFQASFSKKTKLVAITHASNVLGTLNPLKEMIKIAHAEKVPVLVDGAQAFPHHPIDVQDLDCDFYTFSAHKSYGPTGIGVLYGKTHWLEQLPPYQSGGAMIEQVSFEKVTFRPLPFKFEAGTPPIAGVIGFKEAIHYMKKLGWLAIMDHEKNILQYAEEALKKIPGLTILGQAQHKCAVISFVMKGLHPHDLGTILNQEGIAVRAGHHCAMPLMQRLAIPACTRVSFGVYNTVSDVDALIQGLESAKTLLQGNKYV